MARFLLLAAIAVVARAQTGVIEGVVTNAVTGRAIPGVAITLFTRQAVRYETSSDSSGAFRVSGMMPGTYEARVEKTGYNSTPGAGAAPAAVRSDAAVQMRLQMTGTSTIRGRVVDAEGNPVTGVAVRWTLLNLSGPVQPVSSTGEFTLKDAPPGYYNLVAVPKSSVESAAKDAAGFVTTYYPSSLDPSGAERITVLGDGDIEGLELRMQKATTYRITGRVVDETGALVKGGIVSLLPVVQQNVRLTGGTPALTVFPPGPGVGAAEQEMPSSDGMFVFRNVHTGEWRVTVRTGLGGDVIDPSLIRSGAAAVNVGRSDVEDVEVRLSKPFPVQGTVSWEGPSGTRVRPLFQPADGQLGLVGSVLPPPAATPDGSFQLSLVPGKYFINPPVQRGSYAKSITMGGQEVLGLAMDLLAAPPPFRVIMKQALATVRGKAEPRTAFIILVPAQSDKVTFGRQEFPREDGSFEITGVQPGSYFIAAFSGPGPSLDPAILAKAWALGTRINVEESGTVEVELKQLRWLE